MTNTRFQEDYNQLEVKLKSLTKWNKARVYIVLKLVMALITLRTVNLNKLSAMINPIRSRRTNYRRLQKFFEQFIPSQKVTAMLIASFLPNDEKWTLSMDRTNWKFGNTDINILMLGVVYKGIAIPLIWIMLAKRGNSNYDERLTIMRTFIAWFGSDKIEVLLADREFVGALWIDWLCNENIGFVIRIRNDFKVFKNRKDKNYTHAKNHFRHLKIYTPMTLKKESFIAGRRLKISGMRTKDEYLIVISNRVYEEPIKIYAKRWKIETLFGALKSRGFNLEETHMSHLGKISTLLCILSIGFVWAYAVGEWLHSIEPIKIKKHGRAAHSIFKYGLDYLAELLLNKEFKEKELRHAFQFLACT